MTLSLCSGKEQKGHSEVMILYRQTETENAAEKQRLGTEKGHREQEKCHCNCQPAVCWVLFIWKLNK